MRILDAEKVYGQAPIFKEPRIIGDWVLWLEQRPNEKGRTTAVIRPWGQKDVLPQELTPYPSDLRTKIHGYGGAPLTATLDGSDLIHREQPREENHHIHEFLSLNHLDKVLTPEEIDLFVPKVLLKL